MNVEDVDNAISFTHKKINGFGLGNGRQLHHDSYSSNATIQLSHEDMDLSNNTKPIKNYKVSSTFDVEDTQAIEQLDKVTSELIWDERWWSDSRIPFPNMTDSLFRQQESPEFTSTLSISSPSVKLDEIVDSSALSTTNKISPRVGTTWKYSSPTSERKSERGEVISSQLHGNTTWKYPSVQPTTTSTSSSGKRVNYALEQIRSWSHAAGEPRDSALAVVSRFRSELDEARSPQLRSLNDAMSQSLPDVSELYPNSLSQSSSHWVSRDSSPVLSGYSRRSLSPRVRFDPLTSMRHIPADDDVMARDMRNLQYTRQYLGRDNSPSGRRAIISSARRLYSPVRRNSRLGNRARSGDDILHQRRKLDDSNLMERPRTVDMPSKHSVCLKDIHYSDTCDRSDFGSSNHRDFNFDKNTSKNTSVNSNNSLLLSVQHDSHTSKCSDEHPPDTSQAETDLELRQQHCDSSKDNFVNETKQILQRSRTDSSPEMTIHSATSSSPIYVETSLTSTCAKQVDRRDRVSSAHKSLISEESSGIRKQRSLPRVPSSHSIPSAHKRSVQDLQQQYNYLVHALPTSPSYSTSNVSTDEKATQPRKRVLPSVALGNSKKIPTSGEKATAKGSGLVHLRRGSFRQRSAIEHTLLLPDSSETKFDEGDVNFNPFRRNVKATDSESVQRADGICGHGGVSIIPKERLAQPPLRRSHGSFSLSEDMSFHLGDDVCGTCLMRRRESSDETEQISHSDKHSDVDKLETSVSCCAMYAG